MPKTSKIKLNKGGEMTTMPVKKETQSMKFARFQGGKMSQKRKDYLKDVAKGAVIGGVAGLGGLAHLAYKDDIGLAVAKTLSGGKIKKPKFSKAYLKDVAKGAVIGGVAGLGGLAHLAYKDDIGLAVAKTLSGGKVPSKKHHGNYVMAQDEPAPTMRRKPRTTKEALDGMSGRQLQQYLNMKNNEGRLQRNTLGSTRDVLLQEILGTMEGQGGSGMSHKGRGSKGKGMSVPQMLGGNLDKIVKNDMRLKHLRDMGVRVDSYSPYLVKAVIDGDYRSFRTTNEREWKDLVNECALRGVQVNIMGRKTQFGKNLDDFLRNGNMGGERFNTDDQVNIDMDMDEGEPNTFKSGLEGGNLNAVVGRLPTIYVPDKETMLREVVSMSINLGYNPALDLLNSMKSSLTPDEYADMYVYLGQNSLPLV